MHLEVRHLKLAIAIADTGSVTRAANRLHLTQSALSHQLKDIEDRLGTKLFLRVHRRMVLTGAGERLLASAQRVLGELTQAEADLTTAGRDQTNGLLRVTTECYTCYHWLPGVLPGFRDRWPQVEVRIVPEVTQRPLAALLEGNVDVAIVSRCPENRRITYTPLFSDEMVIAVAPSHPLASRGYVRPTDLAKEHLILNDALDRKLFVLEHVLRPAGVMPARVSRVPFTEAIVELVKGALGVTVIARWAIAPALAAGTLVALPITRKGIRREWHAATRAAKAPPAHQTAFVDLLAHTAFPTRGSARGENGKNAPGKTKRRVTIAGHAPLRVEQ
ncbi:MAG TPA: LysR family transcriptional regulator [Gemmatimonadaceae bacterium]|nr:LysR family transcriptional regulator [Gemmatimonadaceae bacterium]